MTEYFETIAPHNDPIFAKVIAPFLDARHQELLDLDGARRNIAGGDIYYIFSDHVIRVAEMGRDFALSLGLNEHACEWFYHALRVHDCGKSDLPADIWDRTDKPTEELKHLRRTHAPVGADAISKNLPEDHPFTAFADRIARHHHEHMDGSGTLGINIGDTDIWMRIACIVDSYDGMQVWRPHYKDRDISAPAIIERLAVEKGEKIYDKELVQKLSNFLKVR